MDIPVIGVSPDWDDEKGRVCIQSGYLDAVKRAGGLPLILPLDINAAHAKRIAAAIDGILFTGGGDVSPDLYGEETGPFRIDVCEKRDAAEGLLFAEVVDRAGKPAFGICRGAQLINVMLGGTLYQDLPGQFGGSVGIRHRQEPPYNAPSHKALLTAGGPIRGLLGADTINVNSTHHQGVKKLAARLVCMATAEDGLIEAAYMPGPQFLWAVQWHPERLLGLRVPDCGLALFEAFVKACARR